MWYESDIDALMSRTANRPIPRGRVARRGAGLRHDAGVLLGDDARHPRQLVAGALLAFTIFFYVVVYTMWLKRWTPQNIVIGGAAGALPPVVGWAAATGDVVCRSSRAAVPDHLLLDAAAFLGAGAVRSDDYAAPACRCCRWSPARRDAAADPALHLVLVAVARRPGRSAISTRSTACLADARRRHAGARDRVYRRREGSAAARRKKLFAFSILYLFALFATLLIEVVVRASRRRSGRGRMARQWTTSTSQMESSSPRRRRKAAAALDRHRAGARRAGRAVLRGHHGQGAGVLVRPM
jgi:protoheme IX farnesyltransferase